MAFIDNSGHEIYIFDRTCRLCTSNFESTDLYSLFSNKQMNTQQPSLDFLEPYLNLLSFKIENDDELPTQICRICYNIFKKFNNFIATCEKSNKLLGKYFKSSRIKIDKFSEWKKDNDKNIKIEVEIPVGIDNDLLEVKDEQNSEYEFIENYDDIEIIEEFDEISEDQLHSENYDEESSNIDNPEHDTKTNEFFSCDLCKTIEVKFKNKLDLVDHVEKYHPIERPYLCVKCFRNFRTEKILEKHINLDICQLDEEKNQDFRNDADVKYDDFFEKDDIEYLSSEASNDYYKSNAVDSVRQKTGTKKKKYDCPECSEHFNDTKTFKKHLKSEHPNFKDSKLLFKCSRFLCDICGKDLKEQARLEDHIFVHKGLRPYECSLCDATFSNRKMFADHMRDHTEGPFTCEYCNKEFEKKKTLTTHLKWHVKQKEPETRHKCPFCSRYFTTLSTLTLHASRHRKPIDSKHICPDCNATFKRADHLKMHIDGVHLKNRPFQCAECPKAFCTSWQRNIHIKHYHTEKKVLNCSHCDKKYNSANSLRRHEKIHTGEMIYECEICTEKFMSIPTLKNHLKFHQIDDVEKQNLISETYEQLHSTCFSNE